MMDDVRLIDFIALVAALRAAQRRRTRDESIPEMRERVLLEKTVDAALEELARPALAIIGGWPHGLPPMDPPAVAEGEDTGEEDDPHDEDG